jgi:N-acetylneuraminate synthase
VKELMLGGNKVGGKNPCFIIAEIGINHNNSLELAKKLIDAAADAGCDAAKFQVFKAERMYPVTAGKVTWKDGNGTYQYTIRDKVKKMELPESWIPELTAYCTQKNILFLSSACDDESADLLDEYDAAGFKIPSPEITHLPLIGHIAKKGKPVILSTGGATLDQIRDAYETARKHTDTIAILHCVIAYPAPQHTVNMNVLETLQKEFPEAIIGYSDHTAEISDAPVAAIAKGAKIIEKHITLSRTMEGPDHFFALEPNELAQMVKQIRTAEQQLSTGKTLTIHPALLGAYEKQVSEEEHYLRSFTQRKIFARTEIKKGELITTQNIDVLRPGEVKEGLHPKEFPALVGSTAAATIKEGEPITWDKLNRVNK